MTYSSGLTFLVILFGVPGLIAFAWAVRHRQFGDDERLEYAVFEDEVERPAVRPARKPLRSSARWLIAALIFIFSFIAWSIVATVIAASHTPAGPGGVHGAGLPF